MATTSRAAPVGGPQGRLSGRFQGLVSLALLTTNGAEEPDDPLCVV